MTDHASTNAELLQACAGVVHEMRQLQAEINHATARTETGIDCVAAVVHFTARADQLSARWRDLTGLAAHRITALQRHPENDHAPNR